MERILAQSNKYIISHEYEVVSLNFTNEYRKIVIGDFYGDPEIAIISSDESYCVIGGCGLIVYYLKEPFIEFEYNKKTEQWKEIFREKNDIWWISSIEKSSSAQLITFKIDLNDDKDKVGTYELDVYTLQIKKLN